MTLLSMWFAHLNSLARRRPARRAISEGFPTTPHLHSHLFLCVGPVLSDCKPKVDTTLANQASRRSLILSVSLAVSLFVSFYRIRAGFRLFVFDEIFPLLSAC